MDKNGSRAPLWLDLIGFVGLVGMAVSLFGYQSLRGDQGSRLFHLVGLLEPDLFVNDWHVQAYKEVYPHGPYFACLGFGIRAIGLSPSLGVAFLLWMVVLCGGAVAVYRRLFPDHSPYAAWAGALGVILCQSGNLGKNLIFESQFKPRQLSYAFVLLALSFLLRNPFTYRCALGAGLSLVMVSLFHVGVGILVNGLLGLVGLLWLWQREENRFDFKPLILFGLLNALGLFCRFPYLLGVNSRLAVDDAQTDLIQTYQVLSAPGHFYPPSWPLLLWAGFFGLLIFAYWGYLGCGSVQKLRLRTILYVLGIWLLVAAFFSSVIVIYKVSLLQSFRLTTPARAVFTLLGLGYVASGLLKEGESSFLRMPFLLASVTNNQAFLMALVCEGIERRRGNRMPAWVRILLIVPVFALAPKTAVLMGVFFTGGLVMRWIKDEAKVFVVLAICCASLPASILVTQVLAPRSNFAELTAQRWQFTERPVNAKERLGLWCRENTPKEALFFNPPSFAGFRLWSRRSVVFDSTTPPITGAEILRWREDLNEIIKFEGSDEELVATLEQKLDAVKAYSPVELLEYLDRYDADFLITETEKKHPRLVLLHREQPYFLYRVERAPDTKGGQKLEQEQS